MVIIAPIPRLIMIPRIIICEASPPSPGLFQYDTCVFRVGLLVSVHLGVTRDISKYRVSGRSFGFGKLRTPTESSRNSKIGSDSHRSNLEFRVRVYGSYVFWGYGMYRLVAITQ